MKKKQLLEYGEFGRTPNGSLSNSKIQLRRTPAVRMSDGTPLRTQAEDQQLA